MDPDDYLRKGDCHIVPRFAEAAAIAQMLLGKGTRCTGS